ncbi:MAG: hypothetical protein ACMG6H_08710 [Acidobacteriota bacterium]
MKKYVVVLFVFTFSLIVLSAAGLGRTGTSLSHSPSYGELTVVPGTELHDNVAYIKAGYKFVDRGDAVDVVREQANYKTGTYTCPCRSKDRTRKCEMVFTTRRITCRSGTCVGGSCLLTAVAPTSRQ